MQATMMHHNPWIHQQVMMDQYQYYQNELQTFYSSSEQENEHTGDEVPSDTSGNHSPNEDMFRLAFAASQWSKLVLNAEGLFTNLMSKNVLPSNVQDQIEQWLCLKQEYEECISADDSGSFHENVENVKRSLERIEEVTETDEKSDESNNYLQFPLNEKKSSESESDESDEEYDQSDRGSEINDFLNKLDDHMKKFKLETDEIIASKKYNNIEVNEDYSNILQSIDKNFIPLHTTAHVRNPALRRTSILPYSDMSNEIVNFSNNLGLLHQQNMPTDNSDDPSSFENNGSFKQDIKFSRFTENKIPPQNKDDSRFQTADENSFALVPIKKEQITLKNSVKSDLDNVNKEIEELQNSMKIKEEFIKYLLENWDALSKQKGSKFKNKFKKKCSYFKMQVAQGKNIHSDSDDEFKRIVNHKKFTNIEMIQQSSSGPTKKMEEIETSILSLKNQMEELKVSLKDREQQKKSLENQLILESKEIKRKEENLALQLHQIKETPSDSEEEKICQALKAINENNTIINDDTDLVRNEIRKLRSQRDFLLAEKYSLEKEYQSKRILTTDGKRKLLSITEHIEFIDEMIEQKNEIICGRTDFTDDKVYRYVDQKMSTMIRLAKLSSEELMTLVCKYIYKVIDLKDSTKNLEEQIKILEINRERLGSEMKYRVQKFENLLDELEKYKRKNRELNKQLASYHALLKGQATSPTRVTRQKNKLVITKKKLNENN